jgi:hypothetical protein
MNTPKPNRIPPEDLDDPGLHPKVFQQNGKLYAAMSAVLPDDTCIRCENKTSKDVTEALRNPYNPFAWFGGQIREEVGLCTRPLERYCTAPALTYSLLVFGIMFVGIGFYSKIYGVAESRLLGVLGCGVFRAAVPIWSPNTRREPLELRDVGKKYIQLFPEWGGDVPNRKQKKPES